MKLRIGCVIVGLLALVLPLAAQIEGSSPAAAQVPPLLNFSGTLTDVNGQPLTGVVGVTFSLYQEQQGGPPLWMETQNVEPDKTGHYSVLLGSATRQGLPMNMFASGEARWLAIAVQGEPERPRVLMVSVPYALKAVDAETIGGKPASAFMLAPTSTSQSNSAVIGKSSAPPPALGGSGTTDFIPRWTSSTNLGNSSIFQSSGSKIGIGTTTPAALLDVNGKTDLRGTLTLVPSGSTPTIAINGSTFSVDNTGLVHFISGQTFPGAGTITGVKAGTGLTGGGTTGKVTLSLLTSCATSQVLQWNGTTWVCSNAGTGTITRVTAGTDLTGGGNSGNITLNLDTTKVAQLNTTNAFTADQTVSGSVTATSFFGNGAGLTNVNAALLGGVAASAFAQLGANNTFTGSEQRFNNTVIVGPITSFTEGQLAAGATSPNNPAFGAVGFTVASGSSLNGGSGIVSFGGSGDTTTTFNTGGAGISGEGGTGFNGGIGVAGLGAGGGPCCIGSADGDGGFFEGGSNSFSSGDGVFGLTGSGFAGNFSGSINVTGQIFAGVKDFRIDDPLDPANKYLTHSSVESSEMMNIYTGNITTDGQGNATVPLPAWFEVLNTDFRYQLTVIGQFAQAIVARKIANNQFTIRTNVPNVEVSWQVTGVRQDVFAKAHPLVVEEEKETRLRGFYIHPELYGAAPEKQVEWARHPEMMRQSKERRLRSHQAATRGTLVQSQQLSK